MGMSTKVIQTTQSSMSKILKNYQKQLDSKSRQNDIRQSDSYIKEKNTII